MQSHYTVCFLIFLSVFITKNNCLIHIFQATLLEFSLSITTASLVEIMALSLLIEADREPSCFSSLMNRCVITTTGKLLFTLKHHKIKYKIKGGGKRMNINFFELKYLIMDSFYSEILKNKYSFEQSAGICYESFAEYINSNAIESIISISEIIRLKIRHQVELTQYDIDNMKKVITLFKAMNVEKILNTSEYEYLEEDIQTIEYYYNKLEK